MSVCDAQVCAEPSPQLKASLQSVSVSLTLPEGADVRSPSISPDGTYDASSRRLRLDLPGELTRDQPGRCVAALRPADEALRSSLAALPCSVTFTCEGVTISGIEIEVQQATAPAGSQPPSQPVAKLIRKFTAGDYQVANLLGGAERRASDADRSAPSELSPSGDEPKS